jgi:peptidyl-tRNA hydrolase, PTH1 family
VKIVAGLGNPGAKYALTRHNVGYRIIELAAEKLNTSFARERFRGLVAEATVAGEKVWLMKPLTFMNMSGACVAEAVRYRNVEPGELLVVVDDVNLLLGKLRVRTGGSAGGHNGLKSVIQQLGTDAFARLRVGVGQPGLTGDLTDFVLGTFDAAERPVVQEVVAKAAEAVVRFAERGVAETMNAFNSVDLAPKPEPPGQ